MPGITVNGAAVLMQRAAAQANIATIRLYDRRQYRPEERPTCKGKYATQTAML